jgi:hypothetical protein
MDANTCFVYVRKGSNTVRLARYLINMSEVI